MIPTQLKQWLQQNYPKPEIDPEWLNACYNWLIEECNLNPTNDLAKIIENVESQLLQSNLSDSMLPGTGLPHNVVELDNTHIRGPPILVEMIAISEIGHSAFNLQNTRQARLDRADLNGLASGDAEADENPEEEGPVPNYPRSMLRFQLSDGDVVLDATEYRSIPQIVLGETPLGFKLMLKDVFMRKGIAFLEPKTIVIKGHQTEDRQVNQDTDFVRGLRLRMNLPDLDPEEENAPPPQPPPEHTAHTGNQRAALREISEPPEMPYQANPRLHEHDDDEEQPRRRKVPNHNYDPPPPTKPAAAASSSSSTLLPSPYFPATSSGVPSNIFSPPRAQLPTRPIDSDDDDEIEYIERPAPPKVKGKAQAIEKQQGSSDFGDDDIILDESFLAQVDQVEKAAMTRMSSSQTRRARSSSSGTGPAPPPSSTSGGSTRSAVGATMTQGGPRMQTQIVPMDVITIEDDDEDDKENLPVPTRHVRRRTGGGGATDDDDEVIEISDSD